tara:strand:+ start:829 stop:1443 length:615 start_codon:yes stop_codon:yes gene_type:complete
MEQKKSVLKRVHEYVYGNFRLGLNYIKESKNYIWFMGIAFIVSALIGFIFPIFFEVEILELIKELLEKTEGLGTFGLVRFILLNNLQASLVGMVFGIIFGIIPLIVGVINGYVLGFVSIKTVSMGGFSILWRLLPHGIFELPAVVISLGLGLKLGMFLFMYRGRDKAKEFLRWLKNSFKAFVFIIIPLLVIAAIIEGLLIVLVG